jgi:phosphoribosylaminoimidazole-succinocarboxamide synthase
VASLLKTADIDVISSAVITSTLTKDYKTLAIIAKATPKQKSEQLLLLSVNTSKIDENREELLHLSWQYQLMTEELRHVEKSIESIFEASTEATQKLKSYMQQLNGMLRGALLT